MKKRIISSFSKCTLAAASVALTTASPVLALSPADEKKADGLAQQATFELMKMQTLDAGLKHIDAAIAINDKKASYWSLKGEILKAREDDEEAMKAIDRALALDPKYGVAWADKAEMLMFLHKNQEALAAADKAVSYSPSWGFQIIKSDCLRNLGRLPEAQAILDKLIKSDPKNPIARSHRLIIARQLKNWDLVIEDASMHAPGGSRYSSQIDLEARAEAYREKKDFAHAIADYKTVLQKAPDDRIAHQGLLDTYRKSGDKVNASQEETFLRKLDLDFRPP